MKHTKKSQEELKKKIATADLLLSIFSFEKVKRCTAVLLLTIKSNFKKTSSKHSFTKRQVETRIFSFKKVKRCTAVLLQKKLVKTQLDYKTRIFSFEKVK